MPKVVEMMVDALMSSGLDYYDTFQRCSRSGTDRYGGNVDYLSMWAVFPYDLQQRWKTQPGFLVIETL